MLPCQRPLFSLPADLHYLNCAYMSPLPRRPRRRASRGSGASATPPGSRRRTSSPGATRCGERFARLVNVPDPRRVAIVPSASYGIAAAARNTRPPRGGRTWWSPTSSSPATSTRGARSARADGLEMRAVVPAGGRRTPRGALERAPAGVDRRRYGRRRPRARPLDRRHALRPRGDRTARAGVRRRPGGGRHAVRGRAPLRRAAHPPRRARLRRVQVADGSVLRRPRLPRAALRRRGAAGGEVARARGERGLPRAGRATATSTSPARPATTWASGATSRSCRCRSAALDLLLEWTPEGIQAYCGALTAGLVAEARERGFAVEEERWRGATSSACALRPGVDLAGCSGASRRGEWRSRFGEARCGSRPTCTTSLSDVDALREVMGHRSDDGGRAPPAPGAPCAWQQAPTLQRITVDATSFETDGPSGGGHGAGHGGNAGRRVVERRAPAGAPRLAPPPQRGGPPPQRADGGRPVTGRHSRRVADLAVAARRSTAEFGRQGHATLRVAALFHDMGKIDDRFFHILHSCEPLTREERDEIEKHPHESADILRPLEAMHPGLMEVVESHHESWDGAGLPGRPARGGDPSGRRASSAWPTSSTR